MASSLTVGQYLLPIRSPHAAPRRSFLFLPPVIPLPLLPLSVVQLCSNQPGHSNRPNWFRLVFRCRTVYLIDFCFVPITLREFDFSGSSKSPNPNETACASFSDIAPIRYRTTRYIFLHLYSCFIVAL